MSSKSLFEESGDEGKLSKKAKDSPFMIVGKFYILLPSARYHMMKIYAEFVSVITKR